MGHSPGEYIYLVFIFLEDIKKENTGKKPDPFQLHSSRHNLFIFPHNNETNKIYFWLEMRGFVQ